MRVGQRNKDSSTVYTGLLHSDRYDTGVCEARPTTKRVLRHLTPPDTVPGRVVLKLV
jgi:hypothetical protein